MSSGAYNLIWRDRELRFESPVSQLACRPGEMLIDSLEDVEDNKGNSGKRGRLMVTNLRIMWQSQKNKTVNLSIGFKCILSMSIRVTESRLRGRTQALYILCKQKNTRFQFIFTNLIPNSPRLFTTVQAVYKAYDSSALFREFRMRTALFDGGSLCVLPHEEIFETVEGCWNLSTKEGHLGTMYITNIRIVWVSSMNPNSNLSCSYIQICSISCRQSADFGEVMVVQTSLAIGALLGFRIMPKEQLHRVVLQANTLYKIFRQSPIFGVDFDLEEEPDQSHLELEQVPEDDIELVEDYGVNDVLATYFADGEKDQEEKEPEFCAELGLAIEPLPPRMDVATLWNVT
eukprot:m.156173 g.156173  ORF g.156173 m.156173 type:complete len:345 (+) comp24680_c0_seq2:137-1171(+)